MSSERLTKFVVSIVACFGIERATIGGGISANISSASIKCGSDNDNADNDNDVGDSDDDDEDVTLSNECEVFK